MDQSGTLSTLVGSLSAPAPEASSTPEAARAVVCGPKPVGFSQLRFVAPKALTYAPADHSLYVLDSGLLYRLELHYNIGYVVAGDVRRCSSPSPRPNPSPNPSSQMQSASDRSTDQSEAILNGANSNTGSAARDPPSPHFQSLLGLVGVHAHPDGDVYVVHAAGVSLLSSATGELRQIHAASDLLGAVALTSDQNTLFVGRSSNSKSSVSSSSSPSAEALLVLRNEGFERVATGEYRFSERNAEYTFDTSGKLVRRTSSSGPNVTLSYEQHGISRVVIRHPPQSFQRSDRAAFAANISVIDFVFSSQPISYLVNLQRVLSTSASSPPALPDRPAMALRRGNGAESGSGPTKGPRVLMRLAVHQVGSATLIESAVNEVQSANSAAVTDEYSVGDAEEYRFDYEAGTQLLTRAGRLHFRHHSYSGRLTLATSTGGAIPSATSPNALSIESPQTQQQQQQWSVSVLDAVVESGEAFHELVVGRTDGRLRDTQTGATRTRTLVRVASARPEVAANDGRVSETAGRMCLPPTRTQ